MESTPTLPVLVHHTEHVHSTILAFVMSIMPESSANSRFATDWMPIRMQYVRDMARVPHRTRVPAMMATLEINASIQSATEYPLTRKLCARDTVSVQLQTAVIVQVSTLATSVS